MTEMLEMLRLQIEWGADEALEVLPVDRLRPVGRPLPVAAAGAAVLPARSAAPAPGVAARAAAIASGCGDLAGLRTALEEFEDCPLSHTAGHLVFADGPEDASVAVVVEVPDAADDASGTPLSGAPGRLLDAMLGSIGLSRGTIRIVCLVPWRPPGGRPPTGIEVAACRPFLLAHLRLSPGLRHVVLLGATVARALGAEAVPIRQLRGSWLDVAVDGRPGPLPGLVMMPLQVVAGDAKQKAAAWADLIRLRRVLDAESGSLLREGAGPD
jgi:DNA polymerase